MQEKVLVEKLREASDKVDRAVEAGERGDWPKAELPLAEARLCITTILRLVEIVNDTTKLQTR